MHCSRGDVVLLPIPFSDLSSSKVRPAVVIGRGAWPGDLFVVPVTSRLEHAELALQRWSEAGLNVPSAVKGQICTIEEVLVRKVVGRLHRDDQRAVDDLLRELLGL